VSEPRTFKIDRPLMEGPDVQAWQQFVGETFGRWGIAYPIKADGIYGVGTRSATAALLYALGIDRAKMAKGVTPELRTKVRHRRLSAAERARFAARVGYRRRLRRRFGESRRVAPPLNRILQSSWGFQPGHDGVDLICDEDAPGFAICDGIIRRADGGGWWGKGAPSPSVAAKGDGIVILECTGNVGPFRRGMMFGYGHAEKPRVRVGEHVRAGEHICNAGMANAWHFHFMANRGEFGIKGKGSMDPMPFVRYAQRQR
jgi:murein DD-endopeptidase MepM/ murein hydrolase activator NlpD